MTNSKLEVAVSTTAMFLLFGTNFMLFLLFSFIAFIQSKPPKAENAVKKKELSKPFNGTLECFTNLTGEMTRTGLIMAITYICEKCWIFDHAGKMYSRDLFLFVLIIFFAYAFYTIKPCHDLSLLGREQTEEWKGWMQFIFLLYHYFHAEEVYNSVRVMITCYVWMTGFGNFSFFYMKQDYGWLRFVQMLWRLNFSVLLLMWTHGNTYILYYICPMHTFYFIMVYVFMATYSSINHSKWLIRFKFMVLAVIIYIIWDVNGGLFDTIFGFLGTEPMIGASNGSVWEWYFRTALDHWSTFFGMIFALNFPICEQFFSKAKGWPLVITAIGLGGLTAWWFFEFYVLPKMQYNLTHSYSAIIPLTSYIFFRNITPGIRSGVSASLHELGKTTLETYLLQHHVWLTSNAKTLLNITPGYPWINFALATTLFFFLSKELYRLTMTLRGMILPDDRRIALRNMFGMFVVVAVVFAAAWLLHQFKASVVGSCSMCLLLAVLAVFAMFRTAPTTADNAAFQVWAPRYAVAALALLAIGLMLEVSAYNGAFTPPPALAKVKALASFSPQCFQALSKGKWEKMPCSSTTVKRTAFCGTQRWIWAASDPVTCPLAAVLPTKAKSVFQGRRVMFVGDSVMRLTYHGFNHLLDPDNYHPDYNNTLKHSDLQNFVKASNTTVHFLWSPMVRDVIPRVSKNETLSGVDYLVVGASLWDALHERDLAQYKSRLEVLADALPLGMKLAWLQPTLIIDALLNSADKQKHMTESIVASYRQAVLDSSIAKRVRVLIDSRNVSVSREDSSVDGVHYGADVYDVLAQMLANGYMLHNPALFVKKQKSAVGGKRTGPMSFPSCGAWMLAVSAVTLFAMDSFLGFGFVSLTIFGRSSDWEAAYGPLHRKIGVATGGDGEDSRGLISAEEKGVETGHLHESK